MITQGCAGLLLDPGLGKTAVSLSSSKILLDKSIVRGVLVIAPLRPARLTWPTELMKWDQFAGLDMVVLHGKYKEERLKEKHQIYVINPEGLNWLFEPEFKGKSAKVRDARMRFLMQRFDMLIIDESTKFKSSASQRFNIIKATLNHWKRRYILTGTPAPNGIEDLWAQIYILDGGASLGPYITHFKNKYFYLKPHSHQYDYQLVPGAEADVASKIDHLVLRLKATDYLKLPALQYNRVVVELSDATRKKYDELELEFILMLEEGTVTAANSAVLSNKLRQVVSGALYVEDTYSELHTEKIEALKELIEELSGQPLLVGTDFRFETDMIKKYIPEALFLDGKRDDELIQMFNAGMIPVLVGNPASVGHGLNLQAACCHVAFYSLTWNLENFDQFIKRVLRQGNSAAKVMVHLIVAKDTVDEAVWRTLNSKEASQNNLLNHLRSQLEVV